MQALKKAEKSKQNQESAVIEATLKLSPEELGLEQFETPKKKIETPTETLAPSAPAIDNKAEQSNLGLSLTLQNEEPSPAPVTNVAENKSQDLKLPPSQSTLDIPSVAPRAEAKPVPEIETPRLEEPKIFAPKTVTAAPSLSEVLKTEPAKPESNVQVEQEKARTVFASKQTGETRNRRLFIGIAILALLVLPGVGYVYWQSTKTDHSSLLARVQANITEPPPPVEIAKLEPKENASESAITASSTSTTPGTNKNQDQTAIAAPKKAVVLSAAKPSPKPTAQRESKPASTINTKSRSKPSSLAINLGSSAPNTDNKNIQISKHDEVSPVAPELSQAYQAFLSGDFKSAELSYQRMLTQDPQNHDALMGLAAIALNQKQAEQAASYYLKLLELDPNDAEAIAGLNNLQQGDPVQSESRLKAALNQHPQAGALHFALGNLYAQQSRWSDAQQSFFRAFSNHSNNADYAFNLAISLDRLEQTKLALEYYQRAIELAQNTAINFSQSKVQSRIAQLQQASQR